MTELNTIRFGQRLPLELAVQLSGDGFAKVPGILRNASISGAFIETAHELPLHTNVLVIVAGQEHPAARALALNACVVRLGPFGFGVEWRDMASSDVVGLLERVTTAA